MPHHRWWKNQLPITFDVPLLLAARTLGKPVKWVAERKIFDPAQMGSGRYEEAVVSAASWKVSIPQ